MEKPIALPRERRSAPRSGSSIRAYLLSMDEGPLRGFAKNYSRSGVFLQTNSDSGLSLGNEAILVFAVESSNIVRLLRYSAVVRREAHSGYGLEFSRPLWSTAIFRRR